MPVVERCDQGNRRLATLRGPKIDAAAAFWCHDAYADGSLILVTFTLAQATATRLKATVNGVIPSGQDTEAATCRAITALVSIDT